jgi:sugar lactone lactonase YvrE
MTFFQSKPSIARRSFLEKTGLFALGGIVATLGSCAQDQSGGSSIAQTSPDSRNTPPRNNAQRASDMAVGTVEVVAELPIRPTAVVLNSQGRMFMTVHWFDRKEPGLVEVTGRTTYQPFPNANWNRGFGQGDDAFNQPLGMVIDRQDRLWIVDCGVFPAANDGLPALNAQSPKLLAFDSLTGQNLFNLALPQDTCPPGTYPQDLAIDDVNEFAYLADIGGSGKPAIIAINLKTKQVRRFEGHPSLAAEDVDLMLEGKRLTFPDAAGEIQSARIGINPITLSADKNTIFYGPMCGLGWYSVPAQLFREGADDQRIAAAIQRVANKPVCNGAVTDAAGSHFLTNMGENAIDKIDSQGLLTRLVQDDRLIWADGLHIAANGWMYTGVNQLNRSPLFNGGKEQGKSPYLILRIWTGTSA